MTLRFDLILQTTGTSRIVQLLGGGRGLGRHPDRGLHRPGYLRTRGAQRGRASITSSLPAPIEEASRRSKSRIPAETSGGGVSAASDRRHRREGANRTEDEFRGIVLGVQASLGKAALSYKCGVPDFKGKGE
jgi:hypothetical protein